MLNILIYKLYNQKNRLSIYNIKDKTFILKFF